MNSETKFITTFKEFINDLSSVMPNDHELKILSVVIRSLDKSYILEYFKDYVSIPFEKEIMEKNEDFFIKNEFSEYTAENKEAVQIMKRIKSYWAEMSDENKDIIWKYFRVLVHLEKKTREGI